MYCYAQCCIMHRILYRIYNAFLCTVVRACEGIFCLMHPELHVCAGVCLCWWQCRCGAASDGSWQHEEQAKWSVLLCACVLWSSLICVTYHVGCLDWFSTCCVVCLAWPTAILLASIFQADVIIGRTADWWCQLVKMEAGITVGYARLLVDVLSVLCTKATT